MVASSSSSAVGCLDPSDAWFICQLPTSKKHIIGILPYRISSGTPRGASMNLGQVRNLCKRRLVSERDIDDAMVRKCGHRGNGSGLLSATGSCSGNKHTRILAPKCASCPKLPRGIPEGLPLCWEVPVTSRNTNQECVICRENVRCNYGYVWLGRSMHLRQDILWQRLGDSGGKLAHCSRNNGFNHENSGVVLTGRGRHQCRLSSDLPARQGPSCVCDHT